MSKTIMLIDDDPIASYLTRKTIHNFYHKIKIDTYQDVAHAIRALTKGYRPQIILLDLHMPLLNGWDFLKWYKKFAGESNQCAEVYLLSSGLKDETDRDVFINSKHIKGFISKPLNIEDINNICSAALPQTESKQ